MTDQNPYAPPASEILDVQDGDGIWRKGRLLVMLKKAGLPARCIYCNEPTGHRKMKRVYYLNPWLVFASILLFLAFNVYALLPIAVVLYVTARSHRIEVPVCELHWKRRVTLLTLAWLSLLGSIALMMATINTEAHREYLFYTGLALFIAGVVLSYFVGQQLLRATRIDRDVVLLKGARRKFLDSLPDYSN